MSESRLTIFAVETSGHSGDLAIMASDETVTSARLDTDGRRHAQTLVAEAQQLLQSVDLQPSQLDVIAVSNGPGSFTGLRVGTVFAKTMAWANECQLVDVDTLQAIACAACESHSIVTAISDAQRDEVFVNRYSEPDRHGIRRALDELSIVSVSDLSERFSSAHNGILTGPALDKFGAQFSDCPQSPQGSWFPQARWVLNIGRQKAAIGQLADIEQLEPVYVRRSYAEEKAG